MAQHQHLHQLSHIPARTGLTTFIESHRQFSSFRADNQSDKHAKAKHDTCRNQLYVGVAYILNFCICSSTSCRLFYGAITTFGDLYTTFKLNNVKRQSV